MKRLCDVSLLEPTETFINCHTGPETCTMSDVSRRDFINGVGLTIASGLTPIDQIVAADQIYPPALIGLRGHHAGSFEVAHALVREGINFSVADLPVEEHFDLV